MAQQNSGSELVSQAIAGDRSALEELLLNHYDRLEALIQRKIPADLQGLLSAEDILQEAFLEVARRIDSFKPKDDDAFYRWASTIADHRLIDMVRAQRTAKRGGGRAAVAGAGEQWTQSLADLLGQVAVNDRTPSRSAVGREVVEAIQAALPKIKPEYAEALRLRYMDGLSVGQTAQKMNRTNPAVHMLCHRGLQQLREELGSDSRFLSKIE